eukprot:scaffold543_cov106-Skeletonema_marinoi.AAC.5
MAEAHEDDKMTWAAIKKEFGASWKRSMRVHLKLSNIIMPFVRRIGGWAFTRCLLTDLIGDTARKFIL